MLGRSPARLPVAGSTLDFWCDFFYCFIFYSREWRLARNVRLVHINCSAKPGRCGMNRPRTKPAVGHVLVVTFILGLNLALLVWSGGSERCVLDRCSCGSPCRGFDSRLLGVIFIFFIFLFQGIGSIGECAAHEYKLPCKARSLRDKEFSRNQSSRNFELRPYFETI